jgi:potassium-transporting ATPase C chain
MKKEKLEQERTDNNQASEPMTNGGVAVKKRRFATLRAAIIAVLVFMLICGIFYPVTAVVLSRTVFPYESNGSQIIVTLPDGTQRIYGSELMGQEFNQPYYLFGRVNKGAPTNISPESLDHQDNMNARIEYLRKLGYVKNGLPQSIITSSGSGTDPHIFPEDAEWQVENLARNRFEYGWRLVVDSDGNAVDYIRLPEYEGDTSDESKIPSDVIRGSLVSVEVLEKPVIENDSKTFCAEPVTTALYFSPVSVDEGLKVLNEYDAEKYEAYVREVIEKYTEGRWLWIFGEKTVNVLLVNLALDGLLN